MAPRVGFEPTTNRLTAGCSTTELPRNSASQRSGASIKFGATGKVPQAVPERGIFHLTLNFTGPKESEGPFAGPLEGVGYGGVSPREDNLNMALTA